MKAQNPNLKVQNGGISYLKYLSFTFCILSFAFSMPVCGQLSDIGVTPLRSELGGRPLAMGGAFVGIADDPYAAYYNPGGLPFAQGIAADLATQNLSASQVYPTTFDSTVGLAIVSSSLSRIPVPPLPTGEANTSGNFVILSYATRAPFSKEVGWGINLKALVGQTIRKIGALDQTGSGFDADFGIFWKASDWIGVGLTGINLLSQSMGGEIRWGALKEDVPSAIKLGIGAKIIGDLKSPFYGENQELRLGYDLELASHNTLHRLGLEYGWGGNYFLRCGLNPQGLAYGAGLRMEGWGVDLTSAVEPVKNERTFSLSVLYFPQEGVGTRKLPAKIERPIEEISIKDNFTTYEARLEIKGKSYPDVEIYVNSMRVYVAPEGDFQAEVLLQPGKNLVWVESDYGGKREKKQYRVFRRPKVIIAEEKEIERKIIKAATAEEKKVLEQKKEEIKEKKEKVEALVTMGVVEVKPQTGFELEAKVTRGELASWLIKAAGLPISPLVRDPFPDVRKNHPYAPYIKMAAELKLILPYADGTFRPDEGVSEDEAKRIFQRFGVVR